MNGTSFSTLSSDTLPRLVGVIFRRMMPCACAAVRAADYEAEFSQSGANAVIASAERFIIKAVAILSAEE